MSTYPDFFMEGPDVQAAIADMQDDWAFPAGLANYSLANSAEIDGYVLRIQGGVTTPDNLVAQRTLPNAHDYIIAGWLAHYPNIVPQTSGGTTAARLLIVSSGGTQRLRAWVTSAGGDLAVRLGSSGGTIHLTVSEYVIAGPAYYEVEIYHHATEGFVGFYRDGNLMGSLVGDTTGLGGSMNRIGLGAPTINPSISTNGARVRSIYFSGLENWAVVGENALGPIDVLYVPPTDDVDDYQGFVPSAGSNNAAMVDESPQDGDTTNNESVEFDAEDLFTHGGIPAEIGVFAVGVVLTGKKPDVGALDIHPVMISGVARVDGEDYGLGSSYRSRLGAVRTLDPDGDVPWTQAAINAMLFGYQNEAEY